MEGFESDSLYHIFHQVIRLHYTRIHILLDKVGIYPGQPPMLFALHHKDGQSQKELASRLNVKPATITVMLNRMEKAGLVQRQQDIEDQRVSRVYITEEGKKIFQEAKEITKEINKECFDNFTEEELVLLRRLLMQMHDNLTKVCE